MKLEQLIWHYHALARNNADRFEDGKWIPAKVQEVTFRPSPLLTVAVEYLDKAAEALRGGDVSTAWRLVGFAQGIHWAVGLVTRAEIEKHMSEGDGT